MRRCLIFAILVMGFSGIVVQILLLREFLVVFLGKEALYAYDRKVLGVAVNGRRLWPSARLKPGDRVVVYPVISGG